MKKAIMIFVMGVVLLGTASAAERSVIAGRIDLIEKDYIFMDGKQYKLLNEFSERIDKIKYGFETEYWFWVLNDNGSPVRSYQVNFGTLAGVGYIDRARVTLENGIVRKVEVLDLQQ